jgi:hypothetical protein
MAVIENWLVSGFAGVDSFPSLGPLREQVLDDG